MPLTDILAKNAMALVELKLTDAKGTLLSENLYWRGKDLPAHRALDAMPAQPLALTVTAGTEGGENTVTVALANQGATPALAAKLTLLDAAGALVLPAYYTDNYISLLPGARRQVVIRYAGPAVAASVVLHGWNVAAGSISK